MNTLLPDEIINSSFERVPNTTVIACLLFYYNDTSKNVEEETS